ncbi:MAG: carboxylating nicotinate-nucleotide diphosphorylase [Limnobacter sp.]|nr:carboxylating nicotinate-nucleotide diphosphorylase [Limnobacter sp.]
MNTSELFVSFGPDLALALQRNVADSILEDKGSCDYTGLLIAPEKRCVASVLCRDSAVIAGQPWFEGVFKVLDPSVQVEWLVQEGQPVLPGTPVCEIRGNARAMLTAERPALNWLQTLSAVATKTRQLSRLVAGTQAAVLDTRKTLPGMRLAQKYAVRVGGGLNQRLALYDGILIKENHIAAAGGIAQALERAHAVRSNQVSVQIEVETLGQLQEALGAGARSILLDNFSLQAMLEAVEINRNFAQNSTDGMPALLEASGGVSEDSIRAIAQTGVDRISVGALTKDIKAVDFSLRVQ